MYKFSVQFDKFNTIFLMYTLWNHHNQNNELILHPKKFLYALL